MNGTQSQTLRVLAVIITANKICYVCI